MKNIEEMRIQYWSNPKSLYPSTTSHEQLAARYNHAEYDVDCNDMNTARRMASRAVIFSWLGQDQKAEAAFNEANFWMAGAMQVEGKNEDFWGWIV